MGIYESVQRSQGNIDQLAGVVQSYFAKKRQDEQRKAIQERFNPSVTKAVMGEPATIPVNENVPGGPAQSAGAGGTFRNVPTMQQPRTADDIFRQLPAAAPAELNRFQGVTTQAQPRGIQSLDDIYALGDILQQEPGKTLQAATEFQAAQRPQYHFGTRGEVYQTDARGNLTKVSGAEFPPQRPGAQPRAAGEKFSRVVGKDGYYYDAVEDPTTGQIKYTRSPVQAPEKGKGAGGEKAFKRSAVLKTLQQKKDALEAELRREFPDVDLDKAIVYGVDPNAEDEKHKLMRKYVDAIEEYEARANIEGEEFTPAATEAQAKMSGLAQPGSPARAGGPAPAAGARPGGQYSKTAINKKTAERVGLNAQGQWEKIPANQ